MAKASNAPIGTPKSGYAPPEDGPFQCHNCGHFRWPNQCSHPDVIADAKAKAEPLRLSQAGLAVVKPAGCCTYFRTKGE